MKTITLYRPVGPQELALIEALDWKEFPPQSPEQPFFQPLLNCSYASQMARELAQRHSIGYVLRFEVAANYLQRFALRAVEAHCHELQIPAELLPEFNQRIAGHIVVIEMIRPAATTKPLPAFSDAGPR